MKFTDSQLTDLTKMKTKVVASRMTKLAWSIFRAMLLIGLSYVFLYPVIYMLSTAFRPIDQILDPSVVWIPKNFTMANIIDTFKTMQYMTVFTNTVRTGLVTSLLQVISCSVIGYGFARFKFKERELLFMLVLFTILVPPQTIIIPSYLQFRFFDFFGIFKAVGKLTGKNITMNLINTGWAFYLPAITGMGLRSGLYIYVFRQFFRGMPKELEDAAMIDGCGAFMTFLRVMVPNAGAAFLTVFLFSIVWQWNDYYFSVMYLPKRTTISVALATLRDALRSEDDIFRDPYLIITRLQAGSLLAITPLLIMYTFLQKYFTESIERTGIVG